MRTPCLIVSALVALGVAVAPASSDAADTFTLVKISNQSSGRSLSIEGHSSADGAHVVTETFTGDPSQTWAMTDVASFPGTAKIADTYRNIRSGRCLDLQTSPGSSGTLLVQRQCIPGATSQQWIRDYSINTSFLRTQNRRSGLYMTPRDFGTHVVQQPFASSTTQFWSVLGTG